MSRLSTARSFSSSSSFFFMRVICVCDRTKQRFYLKIFFAKEGASREAATTSREAARRERKTSGYLGLYLTFMQKTGSGSDPRALLG